ncbi:MAG TPA: YdeI/OmpD-associated family protein [Gemmatimonadales bacterium]|nr:YdeI/OmpD-associated family protein [Gemmatimonadales bacterium]
MAPVFFKTPADFRKWLKRNHTAATELLVGYYKKDSGKPSMTWPQSVDEALCYGWIDGVRRSLGEAAYTIRFTPRKPGSTWSAINIGRVKVLRAEGRMAPAGNKAFVARSAKKSVIYAYEQKHAEFDTESLKQFKKNKAAWDFFQAQPPGYRKQMTWRVVSAKRPETRLRRLEQLIAVSARGQRN